MKHRLIAEIERLPSGIWSACIVRGDCELAFAQFDTEPACRNWATNYGAEEIIRTDRLGLSPVSVRTIARSLKRGAVGVGFHGPIHWRDIAMFVGLSLFPFACIAVVQWVGRMTP